MVIESFIFNKLLCYHNDRMITGTRSALTLDEVILGIGKESLI
jgi:hypothetical protein